MAIGVWRIAARRQPVRAIRCTSAVATGPADTLGRMNDGAAVVLLIGALATLLWVAVAFARYRAIYRYGDADLAEARKDATRRSRSVLGGKAGEQLAPLVPGFSDRFEPSEARFLGAPIDYVIFDGIGSGELREVVLVEVKTGRSKLNHNERQVELAVREGRVRFELLRI
jgi:hypothetical protein